MKIEKHIEDLIKLLKDIRKEPSPAVVGFIYSTAAMHMFMITFNKNIDPGINIKHNDIRSKHGAERVKSLIPEFERKDELFKVWKEMEDKRNELCYGYPSEDDLKEYVSKFFIIKEILEVQWKNKFEVDKLEEFTK